ncbi:MAG: DUF1003 domain-containing protein, partial [Candidatus Promineofilum sp.]|nr:DUF1003 domain-containing protein [Promineifilum sp.]
PPDGQIGDNGQIKSVKGRADQRRRLSERVADALTLGFSSMIFLILNVVWFIVWIVINVGLIPGIEPFDPFPFGFLTMVVSLEAIALAIIVLMSQNRASKIADLREEVDLEIDRLAEAELTKVLQLVVMLAEKQGIDLSGDQEVREMVQPSDHEKIEQALEQEVG